MKLLGKVFLCSASLCWLVGVAACSPVERNPAQETSSQGKKLVLTTFTVIADMAQQVAGDRAVVQSLVKPGAEVHGYEPTPSDLQRAARADLILDNGLGLERWADKFYSNFPKIRRFALSQGVEVINIQEDTYASKPNPHAWMSPRLALVYVENIRKSLVELDPANAATYDANAASYSQKIMALDQKLRRAIATIPPERRVIATCEGAFSYLAKDYGLQEVYLWAVNSEKQATPQQVQRVIATVRSQKIPAVFCESTVSADAQKQVAKESGAKFAGIFYVDSLGGEAPTYLDLLTYNVNTLVQGLTNAD